MEGDYMKSKSTLYLVLIISICLLFSNLALAGGKAKKAWPSIVDEKVAKAKKDIKLIDRASFKKVVDNKGDAIIIDVREPNEFKAGYIPGAINIPRGVVDKRRNF